MDLGREVHEAPTPLPKAPLLSPQGGGCRPERRPPPPTGTPPFRWESPSGWNHSPLGEQEGGFGVFGIFLYILAAKLAYTRSKLVYLHWFYF